MERAHERLDPSYTFPNIYDLPPRLRSIYHDCGNYSAVGAKIYKGGPPLCGNCDKVVPWFFFKCIKCDKFFVQDFRHPKFCNFYPTCWDHTLLLEWKYCTTHKADPDEWEFYAQIIEPVGLNPREFSDEELAGIFDFD